MAAPKKKGLGKGLDALFANQEINTKEIEINKQIKALENF